MDENQLTATKDNNSASIPILDSSGNSTGNFELDATWLERTKGDQAVQDVVVAFLGGQRQGTASTKNRSNIRGSGAKPWRQKGTGRARSGTRKSPIWRGGGVIFGPCPRSYSKKVNSKIRKLALKRAFTSRVDETAVILINDLEMNVPKTKSMIKILDAIGVNGDALIILEDRENLNAALSTRNLPFVEIMRADNVNVYQMLLHEKVVFTSKALEIFCSRLV